jgi:hypothetical protein
LIFISDSSLSLMDVCNPVARRPNGRRTTIHEFRISSAPDAAAGVDRDTATATNLGLDSSWASFWAMGYLGHVPEPATAGSPTCCRDAAGRTRWSLHTNVKFTCGSRAVSTQLTGTRLPWSRRRASGACGEGHGDDPRARRPTTPSKRSYYDRSEHGRNRYFMCDSRTSGRATSHPDTLAHDRAIMYRARIDGQRLPAWTRRVASLAIARAIAKIVTSRWSSNAGVSRLQARGDVRPRLAVRLQHNRATEDQIGARWVI